MTVEKLTQKIYLVMLRNYMSSYSSMCKISTEKCHEIALNAKEQAEILISTY